MRWPPRGKSWATLTCLINVYAEAAANNLTFDFFEFDSCFLFNLKPTMTRGPWALTVTRDSILYTMVKIWQHFLSGTSYIIIGVMF